jgi:hypothetical protein
MQVSGSVLHPTPETEECCKCLDQLIRLTAAGSRSVSLSTEYQAPHEALRSMFLVARFTESVAELARLDLAYFPSAMVLGRSALESALKAVWMLEPEDALDREGRWLSRVGEYRTAISKMQTRLSTTGNDLQWMKTQYNDVDGVYKTVLARFPAGYSPPSIPDMARLLVEQKVEADYAHYILASQFIHGGLMGTEIYRCQLTGDTAPVEDTRPEMWGYPFQYCWVAMKSGWGLFLARSGGDLEAFEDAELDHRMAAALRALYLAVKS